MNNILQINPAKEKNKIVSFIKNLLKKQGFEKVVIGMSGGVDSTTSFYLLKEVVAPENIIVSHLYYFDSYFKDIELILKQSGILKENIYDLSISSFVKPFHAHLEGALRSPSRWRGSDLDSSKVERIRLGNIMARVRMILLYDLSKKHNALVLGTENKSEYLLGYFTRFGDQASDFEPIQHLYKTQVYKMAKFLGVPKNIIKKEPTAGLWHGQTDEGEFGFTYQEADQVLFYYYDKKLKLEEIKKMGFANADKIIRFAIRNFYKHHAPYTL